MNYKVGIVINGYYMTEAYSNQINRLIAELTDLGISTVKYINNQPYDSDTRFDFNCAVFLDKDINLAYLMERQGIRLFNNARFIEIADDKCKSYIALSGIEGIKQECTYIRPKRFYSQVDTEYLDRVSCLLGFPLIAKSAFGSLGEQVYLINDMRDLVEIDKKLGANDGLYQRFHLESKGESYRIIVIGGKTVGGIHLINPIDFKSNACGGGNGEKANLPHEYILMAEKVAKELKVDYCGIDFFCDTPMIIEINSNAYFHEFEKTTGINIGKKYAEYILSEAKKT